MINDKSRECGSVGNIPSRTPVFVASLWAETRFLGHHCPKEPGIGASQARILRSGMKRLHLHRWTLWLLPLLLARMFVPAGFMLSADASGLSIVFCTSVSAPRADSAHAGHHDHAAHHQGQSDDERAAQTLGECPFAVASVLLSQDVAVIAAEPLPNLHVLTFDSTPPPRPRLLRSQPIRGPPALA